LRKARPSHCARKRARQLKHFSRDAAVEHLLMPERVKKLQGQIQVLHVDLEELTGALKKFLNVEGSGQPIPEG